jgi:hypothetical protein
MTHICDRLLAASRYLETAGMSEGDLSALHHFSIKKRGVTYAAVRKYFGIRGDLRETNTSFAERVCYVAKQRRLGVTRSFSLLVREALHKWPLDT